MTDATGMTVTSVPYGTYTYTVTIGGSATAHTSVTITVGINTVQVAAGGSGRDDLPSRTSPRCRHDGATSVDRSMSTTPA